MKTRHNHSILIRILQLVITTCTIGISLYSAIGMSMNSKIDFPSLVVLVISILTMTHLILSFIIYPHVSILVSLGLELLNMLLCVASLAIEANFNGPKACTTTIRNMFYSYNITDQYCVLGKALSVFSVINCILFIISALFVTAWALNSTRLKHDTIHKKNLLKGSLVSDIELEINYDISTPTSATLTTSTLEKPEYYALRTPKSERSFYPLRSPISERSFYAKSTSSTRRSTQKSTINDTLIATTATPTIKRPDSTYAYTIHSHFPEPNITICSLLEEKTTSGNIDRDDVSVIAE